MAILLVWCRYGRKEAWLTTKAIAALTGLSERTVASSVKDLIERKLIERIGRKGKFRVTLPTNNTGSKTKRATKESLARRDATKVADSRCNDACTSPNSIYSINKNNNAGLSKRQLAAIQTAVKRASKLASGDVGKLTLPLQVSEQLQLPNETSYESALNQLSQNCDQKTGFLLTKAFKDLYFDQRVAGVEL